MLQHDAGDAHRGGAGPGAGGAAGRGVGWVGIPQVLGVVLGVVLVTTLFTGVRAGYLAVAIAVVVLALPFVFGTRDDPLPGRTGRTGRCWPRCAPCG